ncbi:MAG TPA: glycosyltransferase family 4 protein [Terriglobales bacterium]|nr:glycosyltransferase family 4 protein [Terriglobales bacterium]
MKTEPISLMLFSNATVRAGAEDVILRLLQGLEREQFRLHLACTPELAQLLRADLPGDVTLSVLSLDRIGDLAGAYKLVRALRRHRIQILHSHMFRASFFASPLARLVKVPVILDTSHGREVWRRGWKASFVVDRFVARQVDRTIAVSDSTARYLIDQKRLPAAKIRVIHNGVEVRRYKRDELAARDLKRSLQLDENAPLLVVAGRLEPQKGHRILFEAMPSILKEFPNAHLICLGDGGLRAELEALVKAKGLDRAVRFLGYQADVSRWLASADLSILPSLFEGLPITAIESLASECPIVATGVDGTPEVVLPDETGLLVPPGDSESLAHAILQMLRHPDRAREMAKAGRQFVLDNFTVEQMVRCTQELYLESWEQYRKRRYTEKAVELPAPRAASAGAAAAATSLVARQKSSFTEKESSSWTR